MGSPPEKAAAYWRRYRERSLPYAVRSCVGCGDKFNPSGPQRRCLDCLNPICATCGERFRAERPSARFCSRGCAGKQTSNIERLAAHRGPGRPRTRYAQQRSRRDSAEEREWRQAVFQRDDFTCQFCGERGGRLQADHVEPVALRPDLALELDNGRTLCVPCHQATPTYGWRAYWMKVRAHEIAANRLAQGALDFGAAS